MKTQSAEKDGEQRNPFQILEKRSEERLLTDPVAHDCKGEVTKTVEDDDDRDPDFPRIDVVLVEVA